MSAYRTPAEMPEEKKEMNVNEMWVGCWKMIGTSAACAIIGLGGCVQAANIYHDWCGLQIAREQATANGRAAAEAIAVSNKAAADRAMFESMKGK